MNSGSFKILCKKIFIYKSYILYMYKQDLTLNNQQQLICYKTQPTSFFFFFFFLLLLLLLMTAISRIPDQLIVIYFSLVSVVVVQAH